MRRPDIKLLTKKYVTLILIGFFIRLIAARINILFMPDIELHKNWITALANGGFGGFYENAADKGCPPGCALMLYVLGLIRRLFDIGIGGQIMTLLCKLPPIICDAAAGALIFRIGSKHMAEEKAWLLSMFYVLNPAVIMVSGVAGRFDGIAALLTALALESLLSKRHNTAAVLFAAAVLFEPRALVFALIFIAFFVGGFFAGGGGRAGYLRRAAAALSGAACFLGTYFLGVLPFVVHGSFPPFYAQVNNTTETGRYATVNAFNFYTQLGDYLKRTGEMWIRLPGYYIAVCLICLLLLTLLLLRRNFMRFYVYYAAAFANIAVFTLFPDMRYGCILPAIILLTAAWSAAPAGLRFKPALPVLAVGYTVTLLLNGFALLFYDNSLGIGAYALSWGLPVVSSMNVVLAVAAAAYMAVIIFYERADALILKNAAKAAAPAQAAPFERYPSLLNVPHARAAAPPADGGSGDGGAGPDDGAESVDTDDFYFSDNGILNDVFLYDDDCDEGAFEPVGTAPKPRRPADYLSEFFSGQAPAPASYESGPGPDGGGGAPGAPPDVPVKIGRMSRLDWPFMLLITLIYGIIAFLNLGSASSPQSVWAPKNGEYVIAAFADTERVSDIQYMTGARFDSEFEVSYSSDAVNWTDYKALKGERVFGWRDEKASFDARYVKITSLGDGLMLNEMAFYGGGRMIGLTPGTAESPLFDEQYLVVPNPTYMNGTYFDEIYHARTAYEFIHHLAVYEWTHPPLGKDIIAAGINIFGMTPFGWRFCGALCGVLMLPLLYLFARKMFDSTWWAAFAAILFASDFMHYAQTRIATIDSYVTFFIIGMYLLMFVYYFTDYALTPMYKIMLTLFGCGLFVGLGAAAKWEGVYACAGLAVLFFLALIKKRPGPRRTLITLGCCVLFFIFIPAGIYLASYIPYLHTPGFSSLHDIIKNQGDMFHYHSTLVTTHPYQAPWWTWPLDIRPIYFYSGYISDTVRAGISSFGNPLIFWAGLACVIYCLIDAARKFAFPDREGGGRLSLFLVIAYLSQYLPWTVVPRQTFIYHYFPCVPFLILCITYVFKTKLCGRGRKPAAIYLTLSAALFVLFYPVLTGLPVSTRFVHNFLEWLLSWNLI